MQEVGRLDFGHQPIDLRVVQQVRAMPHRLGAGFPPRLRRYRVDFIASGPKRGHTMAADETARARQ